MSNSLYRPISKGLAGAKIPLASDVAQFVDLFNGNADVGILSLAGQIATLSTGGLSLALASGGTLGIGVYRYKFTYVTGIIQADGTTIVYGETPGSTTLTITTTTGNQKVTISGLPAVGTWPSTAIGIRIYRTAVGGADATQKLVTTLFTNYLETTFVTSYLDAIADASLGVAVPTTNTTGTFLQLPNLGSLPNVAAAGTICIVNYQWYVSNGSAWSQMTPSAATASALGTVQMAAVPASGNPIAPSKVKEAKDVLSTTTGATTLATFTPTASGNFMIPIYFRVVTGTTNVTITITYNDGTGARTDTILSAQVCAIGNYNTVPWYINAVSGTAITVTITASVANQVYASTSIVGV